MDRRLLKRTIELAREIGGFDWRKLPKTMQVGIDSRPLVGAGRVEDTFNLLGHAARKVVRCASKLTGLSPENICSEAGCRLFLASIEQDGGEVVCKPWRQDNNKTGLFSKADFDINIRDKTITCPAGQVEDFDLGMTIEFNPRACALCPLRNDCTTQSLGRGRTVLIAEDEARQKRLRELYTTKKGRSPATRAYWHRASLGSCFLS